MGTRSWAPTEGFVLGRLKFGFDITDQEAAVLAAALKRGEVLAKALAKKIKVSENGPPLGDLLEARLASHKVPGELAEPLLKGLKSTRFTNSICYELKDGEDWGTLLMS